MYRRSFRVKELRNELNQGWIYRGGAGGAHLPSPGQMGCRGGAIFTIKQKYMRHNEIRIIVIKCYTVSEYHV